MYTTSICVPKFEKIIFKTVTLSSLQSEVADHMIQSVQNA